MNYSLGNTVLGNWTITRELGKGSFGQVFEVQKKDYGITTTSALKVIHIPPSPDDIDTALSEGMDEQSVTSYFQGFVDKIVKEIAIMSSLKSHPNIVAYEDHTVLSYTDPIGWDILIRMELLTPLRNQQRQAPLTEKDVQQLGIDICRALTFCHKKGILHRDIKPANIFVSEAGQYKLGDFGVARSMEAATQGMSKAGTENYMAPEVHRCELSYGPSVDLYSLGLVLYQLLNHNRLPFLPPAPAPIRFTDKENALQKRMQGQKLPTPSQASKEFADIILTACAYDPNNRYQTAEEMLKALEHLKASAQKHTVETVTKSVSPTKKTEVTTVNPKAATPSPSSKKTKTAATPVTSTLKKETEKDVFLTINNTVSGSLAESIRQCNQEGHAEIWVTRSFAQAIISDSLSDPWLSISLDSGIVYRYRGSKLKQIMQGVLDANALGKILVVCSRFPQIHNFADIIPVRIKETKPPEITQAYWDCISDTVYYVDDNGKLREQFNGLSSKILKNAPIGQGDNPFYHYVSTLTVPRKRIRITSALAASGAMISLPNHQSPIHYIEIPNNCKAPFYSNVKAEFLPPTLLPIAEFYRVEDIIPNDTPAYWFPTENVIGVATSPLSSPQKQFRTSSCHDFLYYLEHGYDREDDGSFTQTLSAFSQNNSSPADVKTKHFDQNYWPIYTHQLYPSGVDKEMAAKGGNGGKAECWVTRSFAKSVLSKEVADPTLQATITSQIMWKIQGNILKRYMQELLVHGDLLVRRVYPLLNNITEDILLHIVETDEEHMPFATLDGATGLISYYGNDKKWHPAMNHLPYLRNNTAPGQQKNPFHEIESVLYTPSKRIIISRNLVSHTVHLSLMHMEGNKKTLIIPSSWPAYTPMFTVEEFLPGKIFMIALRYHIEKAIDYRLPFVWFPDEEILYTAHSLEDAIADNFEYSSPTKNRLIYYAFQKANSKKI